MLTPKIVQGLISVSTSNVGVERGSSNPDSLIPLPSTFPRTSPLAPTSLPLVFLPLPRKRRVISPYYLSFQFMIFNTNTKDCRTVRLFVSPFICFYVLEFNSQVIIDAFRAGQFACILTLFLDMHRPSLSIACQQ